MALCVVVDTNNNLVPIVPEGDCEGYYLLEPMEYELFAKPLVVDSEEAFAAFSWGMGTVIFFWLIGHGTGAILRYLNLL
jgi:hypothetical protein